MERGKYAPRKKRDVCSATWSQGISQRLKELRMSKTELAARCEVSEGSITGWIYGNVHGQPAEPSTGNLIKLANALDTTSDYLLGLTTSPARNNPTMCGVCDFTRLSQEAVKALKKITNRGDIYKTILNLFIENESFQESVNCVVQTLVENANLEKTQAIIERSLSDDDFKIVKEYETACKEANATETLECSLIADKLGLDVLRLGDVNLAKASKLARETSIKISKIDYLEAVQKLRGFIIKRERGNEARYQQDDDFWNKQLEESIDRTEAAKIEHAQRAKNK